MTSVAQNSPVHTKFFSTSGTCILFTCGYSFHLWCFGNSFMIKVTSLDFVWRKHAYTKYKTFGRTRNAVETRAAGECFHSNFEFSKTFTSVTITLWKYRENVLYCFYEIKARSNFLCSHRVMVNSFEPIRARIVYKRAIQNSCYLLSVAIRMLFACMSLGRKRLERSQLSKTILECYLVAW